MKRENMWQINKGILLKKIQYDDNKYILKIFTSDSGVCAYSIITGKNKFILKSILGQPLSLIEFAFVNKKTDEIKSIKSINIEHTYLRIPDDVVRQSILLFINELVLQTLKLPDSDKKMYGFLKHSLLLLDTENINKANFPIWFVVSLASYLGIGLSKSVDEKNKVFDLVTKKYISPSIAPAITLTQELSEYLSLFINTDNPADVSISKTNRIALLNFMIDYLAFHADFNTNIKSLNVLSAVFQ